MTGKKIIDILLVEDRVEDAELAMMALEENNLANNIVWVKNGEEALELLFSEDLMTTPKLVLLDLKMPKMDGIETLKHIRANEKTKAIPVIMMTTSQEEQDKIEAYKMQVNSYVVKPVDFDSFTKSVQDIGFYWLLINELPNQ